MGEPSKLQDFDHVIYCSAGNGLWSRKDGEDWASVEQNIRSFDPRKITVVLLGSCELWARLAEETPPNASFLEDANRVLQEQQVRVSELTSFMESLEYVDNEGPPSKNARWELVPRLMDIFEELTKRTVAEGDRR